MNVGCRTYEGEESVSVQRRAVGKGVGMQV